MVHIVDINLNWSHRNQDMIESIQNCCMQILQSRFKWLEFDEHIISCIPLPLRGVQYAYPSAMEGERIFYYMLNDSYRTNQLLKQMRTFPPSSPPQFFLQT